MLGAYSGSGIHPFVCPPDGTVEISTEPREKKKVMKNF